MQFLFLGERQVQEEITSLLKEGKAKDAKIETLSVELSQLRAENLKLVDSLKEVEAHRNGLLEKVERLHADKHKLEDRLNCLEKASFYELSESMCVESLQEEDLDGSLLMVDDVDDLEDISNSDINVSYLFSLICVHRVFAYNILSLKVFVCFLSHESLVVFLDVFPFLPPPPQTFREGTGSVQT